MAITFERGVAERSALRRRASVLAKASVCNFAAAMKVSGGAALFADLGLTVGAVRDLVARLADPTERARLKALGEEYLPRERPVESANVSSGELPDDQASRSDEPIAGKLSEVGQLTHSAAEAGGPADMPHDVLTAGEETCGQSITGRPIVETSHSSEPVTMRGHSSFAKAALPRGDGAMVPALDHLALLADLTAEAAAPVVAISNLEPTGQQGGSDDDKQAPRFDHAGFPISLIAAALQSGALAPAPPSRDHGAALLAADEQGSPSVAVGAAPD
ncbi:hypothetical protein [Bosea sp. (in: a-proteobacteria)]|uniref:hypothetical protein n=1 Tax=Bosea sp. (in: a-proteobacteria) TaxID=1871050 RepID=UPI0027333C23|nr:hypothetical protein [Bosea sp. (in: a-proteobacteria)]MDP3408036.1 hypothetical protein [Bosea sp. (in: a-proteobacteria)]